MGMKEIIIEKCPSNKTKCCKCEKIIEKGSLRMVVKSEGFRFPTKKYECDICGKRTLSFERDRIEEQMEILNGTGGQDV